MDVLEIEGRLPFNECFVGILISRGTGRHVERVASHFTLIFVRQGELHLEEDGQEYVVPAGHTFLLWPGRHHRGTQDYKEGLEFFWMHFTMEPHQMGNTLLQVPQTTQLARPDFVIELLRRYHDDQSSGNLQPLGAALYTWMILREVVLKLPTAEGTAKAALAGRVDTYIRTHHHERISVSDVAKAIGYNSHYLSRIYRQNYQISLAAAIRRRRINHAKYLLRQTNRNSGEIARLTGFEDTSYFQRVFKQLEGITPTQYRRLHSRMNVNFD